MSAEPELRHASQPASGQANWSRSQPPRISVGSRMVGMCASPTSWPHQTSLSDAHEVRTPRSTCRGSVQSLEMMAQLTPLPPTPNTRRRRSSQAVAAAESCRFSSPAFALTNEEGVVQEPAEVVSSDVNTGPDHSVCESGFATPKFKQKEQDQWDPLLLSPSAPKRRRGSASVDRHSPSEGMPSYEVNAILSAAASALKSLGCGLLGLASCRRAPEYATGISDRVASGDNVDSTCDLSPMGFTEHCSEDLSHDGGNCCTGGCPVLNSSIAKQRRESVSSEGLQNGSQCDSFNDDNRASNSARSGIKCYHLAVPLQQSRLKRSQSQKLPKDIRLQASNDCQYLCSGTSSSSSTTSTAAFTVGGGDGSSSDIQNIKAALSEGDRTLEADISTHKVLTIPVVEGFSFTMAVCSYGFFCMMPNQWIPPKHSPRSSARDDKQHCLSQCTSKENEGSDDDDHEGGVFKRPLRYGEQMIRCCNVEITCRGGALRVELDGDLPRSDDEVAQIQAQVRRMCRLDQLAFRTKSITDFWKMHPDAARRKFGFLFRSPTVWEDMVKTLTICNVRWKQSCLMNTQLCLKTSSVPGSFPSPWDILRFSPAELQKMTSLGYRAERLHRLAESIVCGSLNMAVFGDEGFRMNRLQGTQGDLNPSVEKASEKGRDHHRRSFRNEPSGAGDDPMIARERIVKTLRNIHGFGTFATENMLQLLGFFDVCAFDSETLRHMAEKHGIRNKSPAQVRMNAERMYKKYAPFQFLAYWFELWEGYEAQVGIISPYWTMNNSSFVLGGIKDVKR